MMSRRRTNSDAFAAADDDYDDEHYDDTGSGGDDDIDEQASHQRGCAYQHLCILQWLNSWLWVTLTPCWPSKFDQFIFSINCI